MSGLQTHLVKLIAPGFGDNDAAQSVCDAVADRLSARRIGFNITELDPEKSNCFLQRLSAYDPGIKPIVIGTGNTAQDAMARVNSDPNISAHTVLTSIDFPRVFGDPMWRKLSVKSVPLASCVHGIQRELADHHGFLLTDLVPHTAKRLQALVAYRINRERIPESNNGYEIVVLGGDKPSKNQKI